VGSFQSNGYAGSGTIVSTTRWAIGARLSSLTAVAASRVIWARLEHEPPHRLTEQRRHLRGVRLEAGVGQVVAAQLVELRHVLRERGHGQHQAVRAEDAAADRHAPSFRLGALPVLGELGLDLLALAQGRDQPAALHEHREIPPPGACRPGRRQATPERARCRVQNDVFAGDPGCPA
jgi:hypothetical protein